MFIPLHDANSLKRIKLQYVTIGLIAANVIVYFSTNLGTEQFAVAAVYGLGYIPSVVFDYVELPPELVVVPEDLTYISYAFLHGDIFHLGGNMLFLWVFGDNVEDALGHVKFLIFYLLCAISGALLHGLVAPESEVPLIGASGAMAGTLAAYLVLHPKVKLWVLVLGRIPLKISAMWVIGAWFAFQVFNIFVALDESTAWWAHVGGFVTGAALIPFFRRREVPLLDKGLA